VLHGAQSPPRAGTIQRENLARHSPKNSPRKLGHFCKFHPPLPYLTTQGFLVIAFQRLLFPHSLQAHGPCFSISSIPSLSPVGRLASESGLETLAGGESRPISSETARMKTGPNRMVSGLFVHGASCFVGRVEGSRRSSWPLASSTSISSALASHICTILRGSYLHGAAEWSMAMAVLVSWWEAGGIFLALPQIDANILVSAIGVWLIKLLGLRFISPAHI